MLSRAFILTLLVTVLAAHDFRGAQAQSPDICESEPDPERRAQCNQNQKDLEEQRRAAQQAQPPARNETPPSRNDTPPAARNEMPPSRNDTPPAARNEMPPSRNDTPPAARNETPPSRDDTPPAARNETPPSRNDTPPAARNETPPSRNDTPPAARNETPPSRNDTPPAARNETPPSRNDTPPAARNETPQPRLDIEAMVKGACGVMLKPGPKPDARTMIIVSAGKRGPIDSALGTPAAMDVEAVEVNACFARMGTSEYLVVTPPGKPDEYLVTGGDRKSDLSKWLTSSAAQGGRVKLAPGSECAAVLANLPREAPGAAWVEDGQGPSRCERDASGGVRVDPNKVNDYGGVIVLKIDRG